MTPIQKSLSRTFSCFLGVACLVIVTGVFWRFLYYHGWSVSLSPKDYIAQVVTAEEYQKLSNPMVRHVKLSNGEEFVKGGAFDATKYQPIEGGTGYVWVQLKGTAPMMPLLYPMLGLMLAQAVIGLMITRAAFKRCRIQGAEATA